MLPYLEKRKVEIENAIGANLVWNPNPNNRDKVILLLHSTDFENEQKVDEAMNWLVDNTIKFRDVFFRIIKQAPKFSDTKYL